MIGSQNKVTSPEIFMPFFTCPNTGERFLLRNAVASLGLTQRARREAYYTLTFWVHLRQESTKSHIADVGGDDRLKFWVEHRQHVCLQDGLSDILQSCRHLRRPGEPRGVFAELSSQRLNTGAVAVDELRVEPQSSQNGLELLLVSRLLKVS